MSALGRPCQVADLKVEVLRQRRCNPEKQLTLPHGRILRPASDLHGKRTMDRQTKPLCARARGNSSNWARTVLKVVFCCPSDHFSSNQPLGSFSGGTPIVQVAPTPPTLTQGAVRIIPPNYQPPYTWGWNLTLEQSIGSQIFSAGYIGSLARRLPAWVEQQNGGSTFVYMSNDWKSSYSAAQLQFNRRLTSHLHMLVSYTWTHSIDDLSTVQLYSFPNGGPTSGYFDPRKKPSSDFDIRHV